MKLTMAIDQLCTATRANGCRPRTVDSYQEKLKPLVKFLGDVEVEAITVHDLRRYVADLWEAEYAPFTIASRIRHMKRLFNFLEEESILTENPAHRIKTPKPKCKEPKAVDYDDVVALLKTTTGGTLHDVRDRALILLLTDTGARAGGICNLRISDLDLEANRATVTEKGNKTRKIYFLDITKDAIQDWLDVMPEDTSGYVFLGMGAKSKGALTTNGLGQMLRRRAKRAGIKGRVNPHAFRHGFARQYLRNGGDLGTLSDLLGHSSIEVTKNHYAIFEEDELQDLHAQFSPISQVMEENDDREL